MLTMTWEEFQNDCRNFIHLSETFEDRWELVSISSDVGQAYLKITEKVEEDMKNTYDGDQSEEQELEEQLESPSCFVCKTKELITVEYHVVYSVSYQVPMLFFRGYRSSK